MYGEFVDDEGPLGAYLRDVAPDLGAAGGAATHATGAGAEDGPSPSPRASTGQPRHPSAQVMQLPLPFGVVARALAASFGLRALAASPLPGLAPLASRATPLVAGPTSPLGLACGGFCLLALAACLATGGCLRTCAAFAAPDLLCAALLFFAGAAEAAFERSELALEGTIHRAMFALRVAQAAKLGIGLEPGAAPVGRIESARHARGKGLACQPLRVAIRHACGAGKLPPTPPSERTLLLLSLADAADTARERAIDSAARRYEGVLRAWAQPWASADGVVATFRAAVGAVLACAAAVGRRAELGAAFHRQFASPLRCDRDWVCLSAPGPAPPPHGAGAAHEPSPVHRALQPLERAAVAALIVSGQARDQSPAAAARLLEGLPAGTPGLAEAVRRLACLDRSVAPGGEEPGPQQRAGNAAAGSGPDRGGAKPTARFVGAETESGPLQPQLQRSGGEGEDGEDDKEEGADVVEVLEAEGAGEGPDPRHAAVADRDRIERPPPAVMTELARAVASGPGPRDHVHRRVGVRPREEGTDVRAAGRTAGAQPRVVVQELERALRQRVAAD